ncbi:Uncharacterised protein [uncultured archaeon]|nr:Uncharacterised protein [uncultured archaeon]
MGGKGEEGEGRGKSGGVENWWRAAIQNIEASEINEPRINPIFFQISAPARRLAFTTNRTQMTWMGRIFTDNFNPRSVTTC